MATRRDGNVRKATPNTVRSMKRSAENRRCPKCGRGSALVRFSEPWGFGSGCRWDDCDYEHVILRAAPQGEGDTDE